ncbi:ABC transporter ATP-binding protein [Agromyces sp. Leaf222]|uniref:ABC transporter ATP-binding protein n=1 Tax=Agromyces sp. Leaf222 TaxID=1735688 RepID=UPI0009EAD114|nr:ABC transporter ATP-binding protein [Agromyces sp. Leaf222]
MTNSADAAAGAAVIVDDLHVRRGSSAVLDGLSLAVPSGAIVGLLGPSGSGKTTLMRSIVGVQVVQSGSIEVLGLAAGSAPLRRRVAYVTQQASVYDDLTVRQNLAYFRRVLGAPASDMDRVIERTDLGDVADRLVGSLSGGQRGRVSLAAALLGEPELLVLDEPTVGLDPVLRVQLWDLFRSLADGGATLLVSSHVMDEAKRCDRLLLMRDGELLADDTVEGLLAFTGTDDVETAFLRLIERGAPDLRSRATERPGPRHAADPGPLDPGPLDPDAPEAGSETAR